MIIIEDVITTGKSSLECSKLVSDAGANLVGYACIIDRSDGKSQIKNKIVIVIVYVILILVVIVILISITYE